MTKETAMKILKELHDKSLFAERTAIETIIPELKESENEKIRKALLEMVHDTTGDELWVDYNVHKEDALTWLEKQGINYSLVEEIKKRKDSFMREKEKAVSSNDKLSLGARIAMLEELLVFVKEKQGEQKPVWSDEDEEMAEELIKGFLSSESPYQLTHTSKEIVDWLDSVKCRMKGKEE